MTTKKGATEATANQPAVQENQGNVTSPGQASVDAVSENERRNAEAVKYSKHAQETERKSQGNAVNEMGNFETQEADKVPAPSGEPPIPMAPGIQPANRFSFDAEVPASPRTIAPPAPEPTPQLPSRRTVTEEDINSVGYNCLIQQAQQAVDSLILRPGDVVVGAVDVYPSNDVRDEARITLLPGASVPDEAPAFFPANYMSDALRRARSGEARKVGKPAKE
jgi:hypothetical protein